VSLFNRYIGVDYSGAETPTSSLKALGVYFADRTSPPIEILPTVGLKKYWTRRSLAEWLATELSSEQPTLVGLDHAFSFPLRYFETHGLALDWNAFLNDFCHHWPTDDDHNYVDFVRDGECGEGYKRMGHSSWLRLTEMWTPTAKSVFLFDVQGAVAKSTHAGLPWLRYIRNLCPSVHFWPFDGWEVPTGKSAVIEVYPSLWMRRFPTEDRNNDQQAAYAVAAKLKRADSDGTLPQLFSPPLNREERTIAEIEGWILGVT
jgi:hypothetical protein